MGKHHRSVSHRSLRRPGKVLAATAVVAAICLPATLAEAHSQSICSTGQICLGRDSYTDETSGTLMYGFGLSNYTYVNLVNFNYSSGSLNMANKSWRVRNRSSAQTACSYNDVNYGSLNYTEPYSSTRKWNSALPDDATESFMAIPSGDACP